LRPGVLEFFRLTYNKIAGKSRKTRVMTERAQQPKTHGNGSEEINPK